MLFHAMLCTESLLLDENDYMYSEKLQKMLEKLGISAGDSVVVEKDGM